MDDRPKQQQDTAATSLTRAPRRPTLDSRLSSRVSLFVSLATILVAVGAVMAHSASMTSRPTDKDEAHLARHAIYLGVGIVAAAAASLTPPAFWFRAAPWLFAGSALLLAAVLIPGVGTAVNGARRWLRFGPVSVQPSEIAKLALPLLLARLAVTRRDGLHGWISGTVPVLWPAAIVLPLVLIEPDLGTTLFLAAGAALLLFLAGWPLRNFLLGLAVAVPAVVGLVLAQPYQLRRLTGFVAAWTDPVSAPYQVRQALITLGSGGLTGTGLGRGWQKLSFLPEADTDFVFAVIGEELGLLGTAALLAAWAGFFIAGLCLLAPLATASDPSPLPPESPPLAWGRPPSLSNAPLKPRGRTPSASHERSLPTYALLCGLTLLCQLTGQAAVNMAVVTALLPPKGIPLPLVSYGGSNLVTSLAAIGLIISFSRAAEGRS